MSAAAGETAQTGFVNQLSGRFPETAVIFKDTAGAWKAKVPLLNAVAFGGIHGGFYLNAVARFKTENRRKNDGSVVLKRRTLVSEVAVSRQKRVRAAVGFQITDGFQHLRRRPLIAAGIHPHGAADASRQFVQEFETAQAGVQGGKAYIFNPCARFGRYSAAVNGDALQLFRRNNRLSDAFIGDNEVGSSAKDEVRRPFG